MRFVERKKLVGGDELVQRNFKRNFDEGANRTIALHDFGYAFYAGFNGKAFLFEKKDVSKIQSLNRFETKFEKQDSNEKS